MKLDVKHPGYVMVYGAITSAAFTGAIMALSAASEPRVQSNAAAYEARGLVEIFADELGVEDALALSDRRVNELYDKHFEDLGEVTDSQSGNAYEVIGVSKDGRRIGLAFPIWGPGFWARIDGYLGVTPDLEDTVGVAFLQHQETPGLGGRITEWEFRKQFEDLTITPPAGGGQYIYIERQAPESEASPRYGRHVDAITGATGTSNAVDRFLNQRIEEFRRAWKARPVAPEK